jgi:hypothetical protein
MMRAYLQEANDDLLYQIEVVQELLGSAQVAGELTPYVGQVSQMCAELRQQALRNIRDLSFNLDELLGDILAATQSLTALFELVNSRLASPIVRAKADDRLGLLVLRSLHDTCPKTAALPFGLTDGSFAVYPTSQVPPIYLVPVTRQKTLLYHPLLFHEFGHVLYACHKQEMDDLVKEFQRVVSAALTPRSIRGSGAGKAAAFRQQVVTAWFAWVQEFYCDAVGITIGGPCFLKAFSHFFRTRSNDQYYVPRDEQLRRRHPVTWLRTKMLVDRARKHGFNDLADAVAKGWAETAKAIGIQEECEGTWTGDFFIPLRQTLDDMLEESQPYTHKPEDINVSESARSLTAVQLCNLAWTKFEVASATYRSWERGAIDNFLKSS